MSDTCVETPVRDLVVGDVITFSWRGQVIDLAVLGEPIIVRGAFGYDEFAVQCRRLDTGQVGNVLYGLEARVWVDVARLHDDDLDVSDTFEPDTLAEARGLA